jgi:putative endonuclease
MNKPPKNAYVYILRCSDDSLYTGWTTDLERRLSEHTSGRGGRYTRMHRPVEMVFTEEHPTRSAAMQREADIKRWNRSRKLALIEDDQKILY